MPNNSHGMFEKGRKEALRMENKRRLGFEIKTVSNLLKREIGSSRSGKYVANATGTNGFIISYLAEHAGCDIFQRDLEKKFSVRRSTMSNIILRMEQKGFLIRTPVAHDARLKKLTLTEKGWEIHSIMEGAVEEAEAKLVAGLSDSDIEKMHSILVRMRRNLEADSKGQSS